MGFKKLALAAAVAAAPMSALALEPMQDEALSSVTGQDGISMSITTNVTTDLFIEDTDGHAAIGTAGANAGFIAVQGVNINGQIDIDIDAASAAGTNGVGGALVIGIDLPNLTLSNLNIGVSGSDATNGERVAVDGLARVTAAKAGTITNVVSLGDITLNNLGMDIQLGPDAANFLSLSGAIGDIVITNFTLNDSSAAGGGSLFADNVLIGGMDLTGTTASITPTGLSLSIATAGGSDIALMGVGMGTAGTNPIGNVYITGLNLNGTTVSISGH
ncbi:putative pilus subunit (FilA) [Alcanivorax nanhaiticus]|uniref:Putative pilus subunit (FilA) n=1 Tax=Alcanivorax nanhaiticus TaxID=1177154 RepID=A0A095TTM2_9GAMM|nr:DUF6160 family protein [Alcanivorax nanhaiticus]KGD65743.1 putative pilus subunit (FilA) [Alcanivorax nanhaiticus]